MMKVLHAFSPCEGQVVLDVSTEEKRAAAYLFMFRYLLKHNRFLDPLEQGDREIEKLRIRIGEIQQGMKEKILLHGKDQVRIFLSEQRRHIKDLREAIGELEALLPVYRAAKEGDAGAAVRLFTDKAFMASQFQCTSGLGDLRMISIVKVCDPRGLRVPKMGSPSVIPRT